MSDSDSSDEEGIPSLADLVKSLVPTATESDDDESSRSAYSDTKGADTMGKIPSSISNLVQNLVQQYDSISDSDDPGDSSSDDDEVIFYKQPARKSTLAASTASTDDDSEEDDGNADLSNLVENILGQRAHRDSVEINSRLVPITKTVRKPSAKPKDENKASFKPNEEPWTSHTRTSMASSLDGSHDLQNTMHSLPENEPVESIPVPSNRKLPGSVANKIIPFKRQRRIKEEKDLTEHDDIHKTTHSINLNETTHTVFSAASTNSSFDPAELESALEKGPNNEDSSFMPNGSEFSMGEFGSSVSTEHTSSKRQRKKRLSPKQRKSSKSASSRSDHSKKERRSTSSRRRDFDKKPLSSLLGKMTLDSPGNEKGDILSPLPFQKQPNKKKKSNVSRTKSERSSGSKSKRSRSSLSRSSHKSNQRKTKGRKGKVSPTKSTSKRSQTISTPETPIASNHDSNQRSQRAIPKNKQRIISERDSIVTPDLTIEGHETASPTSQSSSRQSRENSIPETPIPSKNDRTMRSQRTQNALVSPPMVKPRSKRRPLDHAAISERDCFAKQSNKKTKKKDQSSKREDKTLSTGSESDKFSTRRTDEEDFTEYERPIPPVGPIHMISFSHHVGVLPLDDDTSISSSSTEEEDEYETESSEGDDNKKMEYGTDVSGSQIPPSHSKHNMPSSLASPSQAGYETDPADADNVVHDDEYEDYESVKIPSARKPENNGIGDEYESNNSDSFVEVDDHVEEPPERDGRRSMLERSTRQSDLSLDDYESDSSASFAEDEELREKTNERTGRRALLGKSERSNDLSFDEYESDNSDSFAVEEELRERPRERQGRRSLLEKSERSNDLSMDEYESDNSDSFVEENVVKESPNKTGRRAFLERSVSSEDLSAVLDEYDLDSGSDSDKNKDPIGDSSRRKTSHRDMLERSVSSQDLSAVLDEYDLDSGSDSGNDVKFVASNRQSDSNYGSARKERNARQTKKINAHENRPSWPAPGNNTRKNLPLSASDASSSVDYTDESDDNEKQKYEFGSDDEESQDRELVQRSNRVNKDDDESSFDSNGDFEFEDDYHVIVSSDDSSDDDSEYLGASGGGSSNSDDDRNYYAKMEAVTRREDQLALRSQRLRRKIYFAIAAMVLVIVGLAILFIVDPLQKDVLNQGNRRLRGRPIF